MLLPISRSMTLTLGLCASTFGPLSLADTATESASDDGVLELGSTEILAQGLGSMVRFSSTYKVTPALTVGGSLDWHSDNYRLGNRPERDTNGA